MNALLVVMCASGWWQAASAKPSAASRPVRAPDPKIITTPNDTTKCAACHRGTGWQEVTFAHDRTGFALRDAHTRVDCRSCHTQDFKTLVARTCAGCHRDVHTGEFGQVCEGCHEASDWRTRFSVDAHRGTLFPLSGAHATLPCQECHAQVRDRVFTKTTTRCANCHQADVLAASASSVDHSAFPAECQNCHSLTRFSPATFAPHDACFALQGTAHGNVSCKQCHTQLTTTTAFGACATRTAACSACHTHSCARTDSIHTQVPGYQCKDQKCYECHRFTRQR